MIREFRDRCYMLRTAAVAVFVTLALQAAMGQTVSHGVSATALAPPPNSNGRTQGPAASALSPTGIPFGIQHPHRGFSIGPIGPNVRQHRFGTGRGKHEFVNAVPVFYPVY